MANEQNLIPLNKRTQRERKEIARKEAEATNKIKAERKTLKEELLLALSIGDTQKKISTAIIKQAQNGNTKAFEIIRDTIGEKVQDNIHLSGEVNNPFSGMSTEELRKIANSE